jgi:hypothetical protein
MGGPKRREHNENPLGSTFVDGSQYAWVDTIDPPQKNPASLPAGGHYVVPRRRCVAGGG